MFLYISLDEIEERFRLRELPGRSWATTVGAAILDEAQKEPGLFEKIEFAYDRGDIYFSVLVGSSQIVMLKADVTSRPQGEIVCRPLAVPEARTLTEPIKTPTAQCRRPAGRPR